MGNTWGKNLVQLAICRRAIFKVMSATKACPAPVNDLSGLAVTYRGVGRLLENDLDLPQVVYRAISARARELHAEACRAASLEPDETTTKYLWGKPGGIGDYASKLERCGVIVPLPTRVENEPNAVSEATALLLCLLETVWLSADNQAHPHAFLAALSS